jgi:hypothetical protein
MKSVLWETCGHGKGKSQGDQMVGHSTSRWGLHELRANLQSPTGISEEDI